jgi:AraC-like DNA-binding protein
MDELNLKQTARKLRMSYRHVKRLVKTAQLLSRKKGRQRFVSVAEVLRFIGRN